MSCDLLGGLLLIAAVLQSAVGQQTKGKDNILIFNVFLKSKMGETDFVETWKWTLHVNFEVAIYNFECAIYSPTEDCLLQVKAGTCNDDIQRYYYNTLTQKCEEFSYSGCGGNANNFKSILECKKTCFRIPSTFILHPMNTHTYSVNKTHSILNWLFMRDLRAVIVKKNI